MWPPDALVYNDNDATLLQNGSALYNALANLAKGDRVIFDAQLLRVDDLLERSRVKEPEMLARFMRLEGTK